MWISVTLQAEAKKAEALSEALMEAGALSISIEDADAGTDAEKPQFGEPGHHPVGLWDHSRVIALFDANADLTVALAQAAADAGFDAVPPFTLEEVAEQNWVQLTQSQFDPIRITDRMWIVPSWHTAPDPSAIKIELDPGMAFGTGSHPTTRLCLEWLCDTVTPGATVLDYGCGSGILGIAAAKLGAADVLRFVGQFRHPIAEGSARRRRIRSSPHHRRHCGRPRSGPIRRKDHGRSGVSPSPVVVVVVFPGSKEIDADSEVAK